MTAQGFIEFVNKAPSPFHAVDEVRTRLLAAGFKSISERGMWKLEANGKYFFTRNQSSIIAFAVGGQYRPGNGFSIIGAHTDSPCLKVKPKSKKEGGGFAKVGVQTYGGGLWHTWFDRELGIAGRVIVRDGNGSLSHRLVNINRPIMRIPTLAIHLDRNVNTDGFKFNQETQLTPMLATAAKLLNEENKADVDHHPALMKAIAAELSIQSSEIGDFELCLYDCQPSQIGGLENEFIFSARIDNLMSSYCSTMALINTVGSLSDDTNIRVIALFDHEEVGSVSAYGAGSTLLETTLKRLVEADVADFKAESPSSWVLVTTDNAFQSAFEIALQKSFLISADMAHGLHPNYSEKHEDNHRPALNKGVVIKANANQRYATTAVTTAVVREIARKKNVPVQDFVVRNDSPCGSTIGPTLSANLGLRTIDVGAPQLSMHSIRETCGVDDVAHYIGLFEGFFTQFSALDSALHVD